jgi:hypothetical protein
VTPKVTEFRGIPRNSTNSVIRNSVYYTEYTELRKTYGIPYKRNSENTLIKIQSEALVA